MHFITKFFLITSVLVAQFCFNANAQNGHHSHAMEHGFIISDDELYFSHLVATGHHSHQLSFSGKLQFQDSREREIYFEQKKKNKPKKSYFLFQAQRLDLPATREGQVLRGHIVESAIGDYQPKNVIVKDAEITVERVHINTINPFFVEENN